MANKTSRVEVELVATDEATPKIERLEKKIDGLESDEARIIVTAQTDRLEDQIASAKLKLQDLDGDQATVQARLIGTLESELDQAQSLFNQLDGKTGTVRLNAVDTASGDIDKVARDLRALDGETATVKVDADTAGLSTRAKGAIGGLAGLGAGIGLAKEASDLVIEVDTLAALTGSTLEDSSRLAGTFATSNVEAADLADIMLNVNQVFRDNPELATQLGVEIGKDTSLVDIFVQTVDGIAGKFDNAQDRAAAFSQFFGEEGARQVAAVVASIDTDLATALAQFRGPIITQESVDNAREMSAEVARTQQIMQEIAVMTLPAINSALQGVVDTWNWLHDDADAFVAGALHDFWKTLLAGPGMPGFLAGGGSGGAGGAALVGPDRLPFGAAVATPDRMTSITQVFYPPGVSPPVAGQAVRADDRRNGIRE